MFITIDPNDRGAIYQQVVDGIKGLIARGELAEGTELPPVRQLAGDLGVNLNTIATAYRELDREGLISVRHGLRAVVTARQTTQASEQQLRKSLRAALTEMALAGLSRARILGLVTDELGQLAKGEK